MLNCDYFWNAALNKQKADDSFSLNQGSYITAYRIKKEDENWWVVVADKESFAFFSEDDYMFWKAENWSAPFLDW
mgnify:CR=1 FL=1